MRRFAAPQEPRTDAALKALARKSAVLMRRYFWKTIRLFAPLNLCNECINSCVHYGLKLIKRLPLPIWEDEAPAEP